jgi:hypothetical protein
MKQMVAGAKIDHPFFLVLGIISGICFTSCGTGTPTRTQSNALIEPNPTKQPQTIPSIANPTAQVSLTVASTPMPDSGAILPWAAPLLQSSSDSGGPLNLDKIFPPGLGRDLVITKCTACHRYGIIVQGQRTVARWEAIKWSHQGKPGLGDDANLKIMFDYLEANFNPSHPEPQLPPWYLLEENNPEW